MSDKSEQYKYKKVDEMLVASIRKPLKKRDELRERFDTLRNTCDNLICGPAFILYHFDTPIEDGLDVEAGYPVTDPVKTNEINSRTIKEMYALTTVHNGSYEQMREVSRKLHEYRSSRGLAAELSPREVYLKGPFMENPEDNVTELQTTIHDWDVRFCSSLEEFIDDTSRAAILEGFDGLTPYTSADERAEWVVKSIEKLDEIAGEDKKFEVISRCAHVRPPADIGHWKSVFERNHDIDEFLEEYGNSLPFLEKPYREGNILYTSKPPANREAYDTATTLHERIKASCFCPIIHAALDNMPRTFCYCGAGWTRQLYEGMFGEPVKVDIIETVIAGDKLCKFAVHLPSDVA
ncbi:MAG: GyrI-like domain-containing protein [Candidatus Thorarchaeota archaeon]